MNNSLCQLEKSSQSQFVSEIVTHLGSMEEIVIHLGGVDEIVTHLRGVEEIVRRG